LRMSFGVINECKRAWQVADIGPHIANHLPHRCEIALIKLTQARPRIPTVRADAVFSLSRKAMQKSSHLAGRSDDQAFHRFFRLQS